MANAIVLMRGYGTDGGTALYSLNLVTDTWSTLAGARSDPAGSAPTAGKGKMACDGVSVYYLLKDLELYKAGFTGTESGPLAGGTTIGAATNRPWSMACDGRVIYIAHGNGTLYRYDISGDVMLSSFGLPLGAVGAIDTISIAWDYDHTLYIAYSDVSLNVQFASFDILTGLFNTTHAALTHRPCGLAVVGGYIFLLDSAGNGTLYKYNIAGNTWSASLVTGAMSSSLDGSIWAVSDTDLVVIMHNVNTPSVKRFNVNTNALATLAAPPGGLGWWSAGAYTLPFNDPFDSCDISGNVLGSLPSIGTVRIGGLAVIGTYYVKALRDVAHCYVNAVAVPNTTFGVGSSIGGPFTSRVDLGAMTNGQIKTYYVQAQAIGGIPHTDQLPVVFSET